MASKTVIIKPEFLHANKRKTKRKLPDQVVIQPNNLREILLNKLIERRKTQKVRNDPPVLNEMSFDREETTEKPANLSPVNLSVNLSPVNLNPVNLSVNSGQDKPYGILKNGTKPTFKTWNASEQTRVDPHSNPAVHINQSLMEQARMEQTRTEPTMEPTIEPKIEQPLLGETTSPIKEKVVLGKNKKKKSVCVLIENNKTRKLHGERVQKIKKTSIQTVRNYLKNHNLIKSGSAAPNPLLRTLYENVLFCGDITNENKENLIHNFTDKVD
jgi:hypothetical protein